jgi:NAD(P)-dependent dehydrogenase (short-subunit alcohol dehydrogenase family)
VIACCRNPARADALKELVKATGERVRILQLDVSDDASIASLKRELGDQPIDVVINNAGIAGPKDQSEERVDVEAWAATMRVNALAPVLVAQALRENLKRGSGKKLVAISSIEGSASNTQGGRYAYRASKAALNIVMRGLSREWMGDRILVGILDPGWVRTEMGGADALISPEESAGGLVCRIAALTPTTSGTFQDYRGVAIRW